MDNPRIYGLIKSTEPIIPNPTLWSLSIIPIIIGLLIFCFNIPDKKEIKNIQPHATKDYNQRMFFVGKAVIFLKDKINMESGL